LLSFLLLDAVKPPTYLQRRLLALRLREC
jgi:hypothetical protein